MIESLGRRVRVTFGVDTADDATETHDGPAPTGLPLVEFVAYGEDCLFSGRLRLVPPRLTDMLNDHDEVELVDVFVERLDGGAAAEVRQVVVRRDEIVAVQAAGPRGDPDRRLRTRPHPLALRMGPYLVHGLFHAPPNVDPVVMIRRRPPMVPLTEATIDVDVAGVTQTRSVGTLLVNRDRVEWVVPAPSR